MSNNIVNISLSAKSSPVVNITVEDPGSVSGSGPTSGEIKFIATGAIGPTGAKGTNGTAVISDNSVTSAKLANNSVGSQQLIDGSVNHIQLAPGSVYGNRILDNSIDGVKLLDGSITADKIANNTIGEAEITDGSITRALLSPNVVTGVEILDGSIYANQIANNNVVRELIQDNAVGTNEIENDVTLNGTVTVTNLDLLGQSPARITGPTSDSLEIKSNTTIDFKNTSNATIASLDQNGNLTIIGTVDGIDINSAVTANTAKNTNVSTNITVSQLNNNVEIQSSDGTNGSISVATPSVAGSMSKEDKLKLNTIETNAQQNVQSDWSAINGDSYINNKPTTISTAQANAITANTAKTGITTSQASAITANTAKTGITSTQASNITTNNAKVGITTSQANAITANTAKTGITTSQANAITANTAKNTYPSADATKLAGIATGATANTGDATLAGIQTFTGAKTFNNITALNEESDDSGYIKFKENADNGNSNVILKAPNALAADKDVILPSSAGTIALTSDVPVDLTVSGSGTVHANNYTDTQYSVMGSGNSYAAGLVPAGSSLHETKFLRKDGTFAVPYVYLGMDGISMSLNLISVDLKANGGLVIESGKIALDLGASSITNNLSEATSSADGLMSTTHHDKLDGIAAGAEVNVQSDWNATSGDAQILNKPTIPAAYTDSNAVSAVAAADNYIKNDANEVLTGSLEINDQLFIVKDTGGSKVRFKNTNTTTNRTLSVPDADGTLALTNSLIDTKTAAYWSSSTGGFYITLSGASTSENTSLSTASYTLMYVAPFDGKIKRISSFHQNAASGTSTFEIYIDGDDSDLTNDQRGSDMTTSSFTRKFTEDCPTDWTFSKGEAIAIKRTDSVARYGVTMTIVFEYDTTT